MTRLIDWFKAITGLARAAKNKAWVIAEPDCVVNEFDLHQWATDGGFIPQKL